MCFHLGKSLLNLWTPLTQSFRGSEILGAISSNHCCPIGQASKRHCKLLPMCGVCVFNTSQSINMKTGYSPFIWKDNFSKISWPGMDSRPPPLRLPPPPGVAHTGSLFILVQSEARTPTLASAHTHLVQAPSVESDLTAVCLGHFRHQCY